jgi:acyl-CoA reductase-like NAD-dependent aldehyde dehydrogenase
MSAPGVDMALNWIAGDWTGGAKGNVGESINPSTGNAIGEFAVAERDDVERAASAARRAFYSTGWTRSADMRASALLEMADALEKVRPELKLLLASENGKLIREADHEIGAGVSELRYYAGLARNIFGRITEIEPHAYSMLAREAYPVAGIIVPWNAPVTLLVRSLAPALAAGCCAVVKVAAETALVSHEIFKRWSHCPSLPSGVLNFVLGTGHEAGAALVESPDVDIISFTGSTHVGKSIMQSAATTLKRVNLELGGSAPCVVLADANIDKAVAGIVRAGLSHAGQVCVAASRVLVDRRLADPLQDALVAKLRSVRTGPADDPGSDMGPMINRRAVQRISALVSGSDNGTEVVVRGERPEGVSEDGAFISPSLVRVRSAGAAILSDEVFGPALSIDTFEDVDEAITKANASPFGLAASVWTENLMVAQAIARRIDSGNVWINNHMKLFAAIETGGFKESGVGRLHGFEGLDAFLQTKHVYWEFGMAQTTH